MQYGVTHETVLGPILYIFKLNDIFQAGLEGHKVSFADDTTVIYISDRLFNNYARIAWDAAL